MILLAWKMAKVPGMKKIAVREPFAEKSTYHDRDMPGLYHLITSGVRWRSKRCEPLWKWVIEIILAIYCR